MTDLFTAAQLFSATNRPRAVMGQRLKASTA